MFTMSRIALFKRNGRLSITNVLQLKFPESHIQVISRKLSQQPKVEHKDGDRSTDDFRVLDLVQKKNVVGRRKPRRTEVMPPRTAVMPVDQDWSNVWPGPRVFHPASVPLPIRQGYNQKGAPPGKFGNAELMKIPNFLHLTPGAIKKHCEALRKFCTAWPEGLETDEKCEEAFPLEVLTTDYCHSSPDIRDPLARIVTIKVKLKRLPLDTHARDKLLRLVGDRYNPETDVLTIVTDRCPVRQQNYDYAHYLLTALFHESWKIEAWEKEKSEADMEYYDWNKSASCISLSEILKWNTDSCTIKTGNEQHVQEYKEAVSEIMNKGEEEYTINQYKARVKQLLLPSSTSGSEL